MAIPDPGADYYLYSCHRYDLVFFNGREDTSAGHKILVKGGNTYIFKTIKF